MTTPPLHPTGLISVFHDGQCGLCRRTVRVLCTLNWLGHLHFVDFQNDVERLHFAPDIPYDRLNRSMHVRLPDGTLREGFYGFCALCWHLPLLWLIAPFLYVPGVSMIGEKMYEKIAARREKCTHEGCDI